MSSLTLFTTILVISLLLLIGACVCSTISASKSFYSQYYNSDVLIRTANQYAVIASAIGWTSLVIIIILMMIVVLSGTLSTKQLDPMDMYSMSTLPDGNYNYSNNIIESITLASMFIITTIILISGVLCALASANLQIILQSDDDAVTAKTYALSGAVIYMLSGAGMLISTILYNYIKSKKYRL